jgi:DNA-binding CsgD family transcriptional regulator
MNNERESPWCEVQLELWQWANMPESAGPWAGAPPDDAAEARLRVKEEMRLVLHVMVMEAAFTKRQRKILELYYFEGHTQAEIARALGITQPTVVQHLSGKKRGDKHVGGALNKLGKTIHKAALRLRTVATRTAQIIRVMDERLDQSITRRRAKKLMDELASINGTATTDKKISK